MCVCGVCVSGVDVNVYVVNCSRNCTKQQADPGTARNTKKVQSHIFNDEVRGTRAAALPVCSVAPPVCFTKQQQTGPPFPLVARTAGGVVNLPASVCASGDHVRLSSLR